jgi:mono/diheme cytochrome c family protein
MDASSLHSGLPGFCAREDDDSVRDIFCSESPPEIGSLSDLQELLKVSPHASNPNAPYPGDPQPDNPFSAVGPVNVMSHSTSLSGHIVSPINPRVIILGGTTIMAFVRGVQRIELISSSRLTGLLNFYVVSFEQSCNQDDRSCSHGDLYTPLIESDWMRVRIHDGEELKNTPLDCRQCHQRNSDEPSLLMRELESPWTHFFFPTGITETLPGVGGSELMDDFLAAKGDEIYGGYDLSTISPVAPFVMQTRVGSKQPLLFDSSAILEERYPYGPDGYSSVEHPSPTWERAYEAFKRGEQLALPYFDQRATDPDKQKALAKVYRRYHDGKLDAQELPDLADIYPDDPKLRARMGLQTEPDASAEEALIQACGSCHNDVLDQAISRAKFNIDLSRMDREELDVAIDRIQRDRFEPGAMPPPEARQLDPATLERLVDYLREDHGSREPDPRLQRAAQLGMAGEVTTQALR